MKRIMTALALLALLLTCGLMPACNTIEGIGKDIEAGGRAISGASEDVQEEF